MKLLTFLGVGNYFETVYTWQEKDCQTRFSPVASNKFLEPDKIIVFLTKDATENFDLLKTELHNAVKVEPVSIPLGSNEEELWEIFSCVSSQVEPGEEVAFDITHGLRHFPLLGFLAAAFLRSGLDVKIKAVMYGAFDVGRVVSPGITPMFDLTSMLTLLEWSSAADRFNRTGDARYLASLVGDQRKAMAAAAQNDPEQLNQVGKVGNLARGLTNISKNLRMVRAVKTMQTTAGFSNRLKEARPGLMRTPVTQPFAMLLERVEETYAPLGLDEPLAEHNMASSLEHQMAIIKWYEEREQWVQMATLAREWLVNWFMAHLGLFDWLDREDRMRAEGVINTESRDLIQAQRDNGVFRAIFLKEVPEVEKALHIWNRLTEVRNDINHAGFRKNAQEAKTLTSALKQLSEELFVLPVKIPQR